MISALPDIKHAKIGSNDEFMILACDGIWNSLTSEEVIAFVRERIQKGETKMSAICEEVSRKEWNCPLQGNALTNSISIYFIFFKWTQLFHKCLAPNTSGDGTGCDNMTAVIIRFEKELTERHHDSDDNTTQKAEETTGTKKRALSPIISAEGEDADSDTVKRIKKNSEINDEVATDDGDKQ